MARRSAADLLEQEVIPSLNQMRNIFGLNGNYAPNAPEVLEAKATWAELRARRAGRIDHNNRRAVAADYLFGWLIRRVKATPVKTIAAIVGFISTCGWAFMAVMNVSGVLAPHFHH